MDGVQEKSGYGQLFCQAPLLISQFAVALIGLLGGPLSMEKGPECAAVADQLPALSRVRMCTYQFAPSARAWLVALVAVVSWVVSGSVLPVVLHSSE